MTLNQNTDYSVYSKDPASGIKTYLLEKKLLLDLHRVMFYQVIMSPWVETIVSLLSQPRGWS